MKHKETNLDESLLTAKSQLREKLTFYCHLQEKTLYFLKHKWNYNVNQNFERMCILNGCTFKLSLKCSWRHYCGRQFLVKPILSFKCDSLKCLISLSQGELIDLITFDNQNVLWCSARRFFEKISMSQMKSNLKKFPLKTDFFGGAFY